MTASQQPDAEHAPLTSPAAAGSGSTGHNKAVYLVSEIVYNEGRNEWHAAEKVLAALRAALAAGDADVAEALGLSEQCGSGEVPGRSRWRRFVTDWTEAP